ncbi:MOSC domain-containing protein [Lichenicola sp.]|uniref:MOSC domain-containing protein n=1 Tax=Lichenicola sp. TaxID=2804529 RepID=UPI003AFFA9B4
MMPLGRVESLHVYPVKGLRGVSLASTGVARHGVEGDRRWLVTDADGRFLSQRELPGMARIAAHIEPGGLSLHHGDSTCTVAVPAAGAPRMAVEIWRDRLSVVRADAAAEAWLSAVLARPCRLVHLDDPTLRPIDPDFAEPGDHVGFSDGYPLLATSHASLSALNTALADAVGMDRFRPSVTISGLPPWSEDDWTAGGGRLLRIGTMLFRAPKPCTRCVVITRDQLTGDTPHPGEPLRTLGRLNRHPSGIVFGANLIPTAPGHLAVGDSVELLAGGGPAGDVDA